MKETNAKFSDCRKYRYSLWRRWSDTGRGYVMFIGLNPSTADETNDDPTIRRCIAFAKAWGYDALCMTNLFAFRATKPSDMMAVDNPVGVDNNQVLLDLSRSAAVIIAAWGANGTYLARDEEVKALLSNLCYLRLTKHGHPSHPLYLPSTLTPVKLNAIVLK
jgi:hypothetical protein